MGPASSNDLPFPRLSRDRDWNPPLESAELGRTQAHARWFIGLRWIAVALAGMLVLAGVHWVHWLPQEVFWPAIATVGGLAALNLVYTLMLGWTHGLPLLLQLQAYLDLVVLTAFLLFTGGVDNPLSMLLGFHVILGGILLSKRDCYRIATVAMSLFGLLAWSEWAQIVKPFRPHLVPRIEQRSGSESNSADAAVRAVGWVVLQGFVLFATAYCVTTLAERLRQRERQLAALTDRALADRQLLERALETTGAGLRVLRNDLRNKYKLPGP